MTFQCQIKVLGNVKMGDCFWLVWNNTPIIRSMRWRFFFSPLARKTLTFPKGKVSKNHNKFNAQGHCPHRSPICHLPAKT